MYTVLSLLIVPREQKGPGMKNKGTRGTRGKEWDEEEEEDADIITRYALNDRSQSK